MTPGVINRLTSSPVFFQRPTIEIDHSHDFSGQLWGGYEMGKNEEKDSFSCLYFLMYF